MTTPVLTIERRGHVAVVTLNRPDARNALSRGLLAELEQAFAAFGDETRVVILTGAAPAFCAGIDIKEPPAPPPPTQASDPAHGVGHSRFGMAAFDGIVIAAINGVAVAGGLELALCCDIRLASTTARFADAHARVGILPGARLSALLPRLIGLGRAKEMALSGRMIDAATAERWGLVNRVVEPDALIEEALALAQDIARHDPVTVKAYNRLIDENFSMTYAAAIDHECITSRNF